MVDPAAAGWKIMRVPVRNSSKDNPQPEWIERRIGIRRVGGKLEFKVFDD